MVGTLWLLDIAVALTSAILLAGILALHLNSWKELRSRILLGASGFVFALILANLAAAFSDLVFADHFGAEIAFPILIVESLQVLGYSIFFAVSWKY
jgi:hypothetical protein